MTTATIAVVLENIISRANYCRLPQYEVFALFSLAASIVSFNWDGLARARCAQQTILHPHGIVPARLLGDRELDSWLSDAQMIDDASARDMYLPNIVLPGEEDGRALRLIREHVLGLWLAAPAAIVVGYSFGLASRVSYDRVWLDTFVEAFSRNRQAPVHIFSPDADTILGHLREHMHRDVNMFAWPVRWNVVAQALLDGSLTRASKPLAALSIRSEEAARVLHAIARGMAEDG